MGGEAGVVIADLEAGIGTLTRLDEGGVDTVLLVVEPTVKSIEVASRAVALAREKALGSVTVVANRVRGDEDVSDVREAFPSDEIVAIPFDDAVIAADRDGVSPLDHSPDAPAVRALRELGERLAGAAS